MFTEYLSLFSGSGSIKVVVKFRDHDGVVRDLYMEPREIEKIICDRAGGFVKDMDFDGWKFEIYRYEIDPIKNLLTIRARKSQSG